LWTCTSTSLAAVGGNRPAAGRVTRSTLPLTAPLDESFILRLGPGGELGPQSRTPEAQLSELIAAGVTTAVGILGTDPVSRSLPNLLFKVK